MKILLLLIILIFVIHLTVHKVSDLFHILYNDICHSNLTYEIITLFSIIC